MSHAPSAALLALALAGCTVPDPVAVLDCPAAPVVAQVFHQALCSCQDYAGSQPLTTDFFDGSKGDATAGGIGVNGKVEGTGPWQVGGPLTVAGGSGIHLAGVLQVAGALADGGPLSGDSAQVSVAGDAAVGGDVQVMDLSVAGTLTLPVGAALSVSGRQQLGPVRRAPVSVPAPCPCTALDIAAQVEAHRQANDNAAYPGLLAPLDGFAQDLTLELPCGRFFAERIQGQAALTLSVSGRTALYVAQGVNVSRALRVVAAAGAELDLFVTGYLNAADLTDLGAPDAPAQVRLYLGGTGAVNISAPGRIGGNLYAPGRDLALAGDTDLYGSALAAHLLPAGPLRVHYDSRVLGQ